MVFVTAFDHHALRRHDAIDYLTQADLGQPLRQPLRACGQAGGRRRQPEYRRTRRKRLPALATDWHQTPRRILGQRRDDSSASPWRAIRGQAERDYVRIHARRDYLIRTSSRHQATSRSDDFHLHRSSIVHCGAVLASNLPPPPPTSWCSVDGAGVRVGRT